VAIGINDQPRIKPIRDAHVMAFGLVVGDIEDGGAENAVWKMR